MAGITLAQAQAQLDESLAALTAARARKSYTLNGRSMTFHDVQALQKDVEFWSAKVQELSMSATRRGRSATLVR